jgi:hypothetical protein
VVKNYLAKHIVKALEHPPCPSDLSLLELFLFPQVKSVLKRQRFTNAKEVGARATKALTEVLRNGFQEFFQKFYEHC